MKNRFCLLFLGAILTIGGCSKPPDSQFLVTLKGDAAQKKAVQAVLTQRLANEALTQIEVADISENSFRLTVKSLKPERREMVKGYLEPIGRLQFRMLHQDSYALVEKMRRSPEQFQMPEGYEAVCLCQAGNTEICLVDRLAQKIDNQDIQHATAISDPVRGYSLSIKLTEPGARQFEKITTTYKAKDHQYWRMAISVDDQVFTAPAIYEPITRGNLAISGCFTRDEARNLSRLLNARALPVPIQVDILADPAKPAKPKP